MNSSQPPIDIELVKRVEDAIHEAWHTNGTTVGDVAKAAIAAVRDLEAKTPPQNGLSRGCEEMDSGGVRPREIPDNEKATVLQIMSRAYMKSGGWSAIGQSELDALVAGYEAIRPCLCTTKPVSVSLGWAVDEMMEAAYGKEYRGRQSPMHVAMAKAVLKAAGVSYAD